MRFRTLRSRLTGVALLALVVLGWVYLAPTEIGGATTYVVTHGISMEPRFHTGDLALLRPADDYRVGEIVAYHSTVWHMVVMHRIVGRVGNRYVFKGDHNDFLDPNEPTRAQLIGRLWIHIPHAGVVLYWLHTPAVAAVLCGAVAALLLLGGTRRRRRRDRRRPHGGRRAPPTKAVPAMSGLRSQVVGHRTEGLTGVAVAVVAFLLLSLFAFAAPTDRTVGVAHPYTESVSFGYRAHAPLGPVYPLGIVTTGDPIFTSLVHRITVTVAYRFSAVGTAQLRGTLGLAWALTSPTGWSRSAELGRPVRFAGGRAHTAVLIDLPSLQELIDRVAAQTGGAATGTDTLTITPRVHLTGVLAGQPLATEFTQGLTFQLGGPELTPGSTSGGTPLHRTVDGSVAGLTTIQNKLGVGAVQEPVAVVRWIAFFGLALALGAALLVRQWTRDAPVDPGARIQARYRNLIVSIGEMTVDPTRPSIAVTDIDALARLAERSERLILHHHRDGFDSYFVDDEGTLYRYEPGGSGQRPPPVAAAPPVPAAPPAVPAPAAMPTPAAMPAAPLASAAPVVTAPPAAVLTTPALSAATATPPGSRKPSAAVPAAGATPSPAVAAVKPHPVAPPRPAPAPQPDPVAPPRPAPAVPPHPAAAGQARVLLDAFVADHPAAATRLARPIGAAQRAMGMLAPGGSLRQPRRPTRGPR